MKRTFDIERDPSFIKIEQLFIKILGDEFICSLRPFQKYYLYSWLVLLKKTRKMKGKKIGKYLNGYTKYKTSAKTLYRKRKLYKEHSIMGLIPKWGSRRGQKK